MSDQKSSRCIGIVGRIFGHKFLKSQGGFVHGPDACFRCGRPFGRTP